MMATKRLRSTSNPSNTGKRSEGRNGRTSKLAAMGRRSRRQRSVFINEADVIDLWISVGTANGLTTDDDIARFLLSLMLCQHAGKPFALHYISQAIHRRVIPDRCLKAYSIYSCWRGLETLCFSHGNSKESKAELDTMCTHCNAPLVLSCLICQQTSSQTLPTQAHLPSQSPPVHLPSQSPPVHLPSQSPPVHLPSQSPPVHLPSQSPPVHLPSQSPPVHLPSQSPPVGSPFATEEQSSDQTARHQSGAVASPVQEYCVGLASLGSDIIVKDKSSDIQLVNSLMEIPEDSIPDDTDSEEMPNCCDVGAESEQMDGDDVDMQRAVYSDEVSGAMFVCPYCSQVFRGDRHKVHVKTHNSLEDDGIFRCIVCNKSFSQFHTLYNHMRLSTEQQRCAQCGQVFTSHCQISKHMKHHHKEKARFCTRCNQSFPCFTKKDFDRHINKHVKKEKGKCSETALCPHCGKVFKRKDELNNHMTYHNKENPFPCLLCGKAFKNKSCLRQHEQFHGEKTQQCEVCGAKFHRKPSLRRHMQKHSGKQHGCEECSRRFCSSTELQVHVEAVHKGIRRFPCSHCNHKFYKEASLKIHMRKHTGEKPYQCQQCPAKFAVGEALRKHMRRHTGEKPYRCEDCGQAYSCQHSYKMHRKKHHSDSVYPCCDCTQVFAIRSSLDFHRKMCHTGKFEINTENIQPSGNTVHQENLHLVP